MILSSSNFNRKFSNVIALRKQNEYNSQGILIEMNVPKKTVLLVDDDEIVRDIIKSAFEREYMVLEAKVNNSAIPRLSFHGLLARRLSGGTGESRKQKTPDAR